MRKRLFFGLAGGLAGIGIKPLLSGSMEMSDGLLLAVCGIAGLIVGVALSIFMDVFSSNLGEADVSHQD